MKGNAVRRTSSETIETSRLVARGSELIASFGEPLRMCSNVEVLESVEVVAVS